MTDRASIKAQLSTLVVDMEETRSRIKHAFSRRSAIRNAHPSALNNPEMMRIIERYDAEILADQTRIDQLKANIEGLEAALK